jgi:hypothetical protein
VQNHQSEIFFFVVFVVAVIEFSRRFWLFSPFFDRIFNASCKDSKESWSKEPGFGYPQKGFALLAIH